MNNESGTLAKKEHGPLQTYVWDLLQFRKWNAVFILGRDKRREREEEDGEGGKETHNVGEKV